MTASIPTLSRLSAIGRFWVGGSNFGPISVAMWLKQNFRKREINNYYLKYLDASYLKASFYLRLTCKSASIWIELISSKTWLLTCKRWIVWFISLTKYSFVKFLSWADKRTGWVGRMLIGQWPISVTKWVWTPSLKDLRVVSVPPLRSFLNCGVNIQDIEKIFLGMWVEFFETPFSEKIEKFGWWEGSKRGL